VKIKRKKKKVGIDFLFKKTESGKGIHALTLPSKWLGTFLI
jgi:hypothetical protein